MTENNGSLLLKPQLLFILISTALISNSCGWGLCGEDVTKEMVSPNRRMTATVYQRGCGATTPFVYHINIHPTDERLRSDYYGRVGEKKVFVVGRYGDIDVKWTNDSELQVKCSACGTPSKQESRWNGVTINYI